MDIVSPSKSTVPRRDFQLIVMARTLVEETASRFVLQSYHRPPPMTVLEQADLKTFAVHGCHGTSVVTAVTAQNRTGVLRHVMPPHFVEQQACITSTLKDIRVHAIKTGTLFNSEITKAVASSLKCHFRTHGPVPFVCDSVYVSEYGVVLSAEDVKTVVKELSVA
ncbi:Phosphomethylpyrimidine kinase domain containing protein [Tylopilus felleus]